MKKTCNGNCIRNLLAGVAVAALVAGAAFVSTGSDFGLGDGTALAQSGQGQGQGRGGSGGSGGDHGGGEGAGNQGASSGGGGGAGNRGQTVGPRGEDDDSDGRGPQYGKPGDGDRGGKPSWAQEGIPEVELGRLNVIRSPDKVLDRALVEVLANFDPDVSAYLYEMTARDFAAEILANWDSVTIIDSPLENLALLDELWSTGTTSLPGVTPASSLELAGILIGAASDKSVPITGDTVLALSIIVGIDLTHAVVDSIALKAEAVRDAIAEAHG